MISESVDIFWAISKHLSVIGAVMTIAGAAIAIAAVSVALISRDAIVIDEFRDDDGDWYVV